MGKLKKYILGVLSVLFLVMAMAPMLQHSTIQTTYADDSDEEKDKD